MRGTCKQKGRTKSEKNNKVTPLSIIPLCTISVGTDCVQNLTKTCALMTLKCTVIHSSWTCTLNQMLPSINELPHIRSFDTIPKEL